ncbi:MULTISPECIES: MFS transporter [Amycolatopsis]|uniref:MFS transporter n=1 Tax=Amycolatopsis albidoflavus TaxID=102226 RepID=A0ABW5HU93_9PSEU
MSTSPDASTESAELPPAARRRLLAATFTGTVLEWYDFFIYAAMSALVFDKLFFPALGPTTGLLASFGTFAVGFVARPLGGLAFGRIADSRGRKPALVLSMLVVGAVTVLIGVLPTYHDIGVLAPVALVVLRFFHGFALGGEWGSAASLLVEHAPPGKRGAYTAWLQFGSAAGNILASVTVLLMTALLSTSQILAWGWRIPFLVSFVIVFIGIYVRRNLPESRAFTHAAATAPDPAPLRAVFRENSRSVLTVFFLHVSQSTLTYLITFTIAHTTGALQMDRPAVLSAILIAQMVTTPFFFTARLADRIGAAKVYIAGTLAMAAFAFPFFLLIDTGSLFLTFVSIGVVCLLISVLYSVQGKYYTEMFTVRRRATGTAIGVQLGSIVAGLMPTIAVLLVTLGEGSTWLVSLYLLGTSLLGTVAALSTQWRAASADTPSRQTRTRSADSPRNRRRIG